MEEVIIGLVIVIALITGIVIARVIRRNRRALDDQRAAELSSSLAAPLAVAEADVTRFGEELRAIDVSGRPLTDSARQDYDRALDAYEQAKQSLAAVTHPHEITHVTEILTDGRYAAACYQARVAGEPLPAKRPPCYFDPAHGPSARNIDWSHRGEPTRSVPACAADIERIEAGGSPYIRTVQEGARRVPYWEAGREYAPWAQGYFEQWKGSDLLKGAAVGSLVLGGLAVLPKLLDGLGELADGWGDLDLEDFGDIKDLKGFKGLKDLFD